MLSVKQKKIQKEIGTQKGLRWGNWRWHLKHSVTDVDTFELLLGVKLPSHLREQFEKVTARFPMSVTPYYISLIDTNDLEHDPVFKQCFPVQEELDIVQSEMADPLHEDKDSMVEGLTHRYPDRVLFLVSNSCSMYCRHCTRKRRVGDPNSIPSRSVIEKAIEYIAKTPQIRDVLLSGGDPLMLSTKYLDWILTEIQKIPHVEIIRIGTRMPVVLPYRIDKELVKMLKKHHPLWINTHFNHPRELTASSCTALKMLADAGIPLGNQSVLLAGVNDCPRVMKSLVQKLVANRVRPYYIYQCDLSEGLNHFRTSVGKGIEIMESLIGHTSGLCVPTYVIDAPGGGGKIPVMPTYQISRSTNKVILRNYEGVITSYQEPDSYQAGFCDRNCAKCNLQLPTTGANECRSIGIEKLLADYDETIALVPKNNPRHGRRQ
ncbi:MAG: lysine 2,3-aminomutase [Verrucomicrobiae bacterium]|nr:lysine 2,3-aminomutase [Verrucomicrobiae bacterium]